MEGDGAQHRSSSTYQSEGGPQSMRHSATIERSDSSSSSDHEQQQQSSVHAPVAMRPRLSNRQSSGAIMVSTGLDDALRPSDTNLEADDMRTMSPRRTSEDLQELGRQTRDEVREHAKMLQDSLLMIFHRIQAVKEEHDKLDNNNKFLQKYIGDLMSTSKITASSSSRGKK